MQARNCCNIFRDYALTIRGSSATLSVNPGTWVTSRSCTCSEIAVNWVSAALRSNSAARAADTARERAGGKSDLMRENERMQVDLASVRASLAKESQTAREYEISLRRQRADLRDQIARLSAEVEQLRAELEQQAAVNKLQRTVYNEAQREMDSRQQRERVCDNLIAYV